MKGKCKNLDGNCPNFGKIIEIPDEDEFICPKCGHPLYEIANEPSRSGLIKKILLMVTILVFVIVSIVVISKIFLNDNHDNIGGQDPKDHINDTIPQIDSVRTNEYDSQEPNDNVQTDSVYIIKETCRVDTVYAIKDLDKRQPTIQYSFGYYIGETNAAGIPDGNGKMYYTTRTPIATHDLDQHFAEIGDFYYGSWANGDIMSGKLFREDGTVKEILIVGKRPNPADLEKIYKEYVFTLKK